MLQDNKILLGMGENPCYLLPSMANRHGLIAGATGTGKTSTLRVLAEGFSDLGVPVFLADVKGDVSSLALAGQPSEKTTARLNQLGINPMNFPFKSYPCRFWDVFGQGGIPVRATVSDIGPTLLSRLLGLTEVQAGVLNIAFRVADDNGWQLIDFKDLRTMLTWVAEHNKELTTTYGNVSSQSVGAIQRALLALQDAGAEEFLGEPMLDIRDWMRAAPDGRGVINLLHCVKLAQQPLLYATFMLWMLSEVYEIMPEAGDLDKPRLVFFFDEAHLIFKGAPKALVEKVVQVIKLIRSKAVGIYFISQSPADIPDEVLAQLNNRVQHALRAYTPAEQKAVRVAAQSFRPNPHFKTEDAISGMGIGVALVSMLEANGAPAVVEQAIICPPQSSFTPLEDAARCMLVAGDGLYPKYRDAVDNISAYEILTEEQAALEAQRQAELEAKEAEKAAAEAEKQAAREAKAAEKAAAEAEKQAAREAKAAEKAAAQAAREEKAALQAKYKAEGRDSKGRTSLERSLRKAASSTARGVGRDVGKQITRGVLGNSNNRVTKAAGSFVGSMAGDLFSSFFK